MFNDFEEKSVIDKANYKRVEYKLATLLFYIVVFMLII